MTWIEAYRQKLGMSREQFAAAVTRELGGTGERRKCVSANLIYMLENWPKCVTHPALITMIAHACGATKAQRDQFLAKERRGYPFRHFPARVRSEAPRRAPMKEEKPERNHRHDHARIAVVVLDRTGRVVRRCESMLDAAEVIGMTAPSVRARCLRRAAHEFCAGSVYTCRYAAEWDGMSQTARAADMRRALELGGDMKRKPNGGLAKRAVVVLDKAGRELARYDSIMEASRGEVTNDDYIRTRCYRKVRAEFTGKNDSTYRFAADWDKMTPEERAKDLSAAM